ncbi:hypothetical protein Lal_00042385 [Lupinus albus]|nr:hypothetical protein Lal_00042385 [Lupinus albus]
MLSLKRGILAQARIQQPPCHCPSPRRAKSRLGENSPASAILLSLRRAKSRPGENPTKSWEQTLSLSLGQGPLAQARNIQLMQVDITGFGLVCEWDDYDRKGFYPSLCRTSKEEIEQRNDIELQLMYAMKYNIKINWAQMIMQQMGHVRGSQSPLPYAIFITKILEHFGVSLDGETKMALNLHESKIDVEVVHNMGFSLDPITRRTYRHRTDRPTVPIAQPEPTIPNLPEFQAPSSSSAAMPSNQMIMDDLVSL